MAPPPGCPIPREAPPPSGTWTRPNTKPQDVQESPTTASTARAWRHVLADLYIKLFNLTTPPQSRSVEDINDAEDDDSNTPSVKEPRTETLSRAIEYIEKLLEENEAFKTSLASREVLIQQLEEQTKQASTTIFSKFVDAQVNGYLHGQTRSLSALGRNGPREVKTPAAMPGKQPRHMDTSGPTDRVQNDKCWDEAVAQLCMPKGAILPPEPKSRSTDSNKIRQQGPDSSNNSATTSRECSSVGQAISAFNPLTPLSAAPSSSFRVDSSSAPSTGLPSVVNVPDMAIPMLPPHILTPLCETNIAFRVSDPVNNRSITSNSHTSSKGRSSPTATNSSRQTRDFSAGGTTPGRTPDPSLLVRQAPDVRVENQSSFGLSTDVVEGGYDAQNPGKTASDPVPVPVNEFSNYFEQFSDVYSQWFPSFSETVAFNHVDTTSPFGPNRGLAVSSSVSMESASVADPSRRLSIVNMPRRSNGFGTSGTSPGYGFSSTTSEGENPFRLASLPSLTNLRIHTSTIRGRRQQKKRSNMAPRPLASQADLSVANGLEVSGQQERVLGATPPTMGAHPAFPSHRNGTNARAVNKWNISGVNVPGGADFQPSAAASMSLGSMAPPSVSSYDYYGQNLQASSGSAPPCNPSSFSESSTHPQLFCIPVTPEEDPYKLPKASFFQTSSAPEAVGMDLYQSVASSDIPPPACISGSYHSEPQQPTQMPYSGLSQPFPVETLKYPAPTRYSEAYPDAAHVLEQQKNSGLIYTATAPTNTQESNAHKRRMPATVMRPCTYSHNDNFTQASIQPTTIATTDQQASLRRPDKSNPYLQNWNPPTEGLAHPYIAMPETDKPFKQSNEPAVVRPVDNVGPQTALHVVPQTRTKRARSD